MNKRITSSDARPAAAPSNAPKPAALTRQKRTFRFGIQFAPMAACVAAPAVVGAFIDPDFLYTRPLQMLAIVGVAVATIGLIMLLHGLSRRSRRLHSLKFWLSVLANVLVIIAVVAASVHSYRWGHPLPAPNATMDNSE